MADWEEELGLNNVRPFDRPMTAGSNDRVVGQDELGQTIYETPTGQRYTVRPATEEESKTTRAKAEEWIDEGAPLPSWDQIVDTMKAIPGEAYDSVARTVRGEGTYGDVMGAVATMAAPGTSRALDFDPNTTRMFFGTDSPKADLYMFNRASVMEQNGFTPEEIWQSTGWWNSPNGWRFEVDDSKASIHPLAVNAALNEPLEAARVVKANLFDVVDHPEYVSALEKTDFIDNAVEKAQIRLQNFPEQSGSYSSITSDITAKGPDEEALRSVLLHELQHLEQKSSDRASQGANPSGIIRQLDTTLNQLPREALEYLVVRREIDLLINAVSMKRDAIKSGSPKGWEGTELDFINQMDVEQYDYAITELKRQRNENKQNFSRQFGDGFKKSLDDLYTITGGFTDLLQDQTGDGVKTPIPQADRTDKLTDLAHDLYHRNVGEAEARLTQKRKDLTAAERAVRFPEKDYDVDPKSLIDEADVAKVFNNVVMEWENVQNKRGYATGGMVEQPMMDPVSKNPVPTGATPKEVRDDVPIMASEGEYVIPANVVRYLGLDKIEKLVNQAKKGLEELDMKGRIGGQTEDDLPFSAEELQTVEQQPASQSVPQMATGGMVLNEMEIDQATGLPVWLVNMQRGQRTPAPAQQAAQAVPVVPAPVTNKDADTKDGGAKNQRPEKLTGLAADPKDWDVDTYNKYATARTSVDQKVGQAMAGLVPFGGIAARVRERYLERNVPKRMEQMIASGKDAQGNPLSPEQVGQLRTSLDTIRGQKVSQVGGIAGVVQAVARDTGLIRPRATAPATATTTAPTPAPARAAPSGGGGKSGSAAGKTKTKSSTAKGSGPTKSETRQTSSTKSSSTKSKSKQGNTAR